MEPKHLQVIRLYSAMHADYKRHLSKGVPQVAIYLDMAMTL